MESADLFKALGDKTRLKIIKVMLSKGELCVSDIHKEVGTSQPNISQHLKELKRYGVVEMEKINRTCCYKIKNSKKIKKILDLADE